MDLSALDWSAVLALLAALGVDSLLTTLIVSAVNKKEREAKVTDLVTTAFQRLSEAQSVRIEDLEEELANVKRIVSEKDIKAIEMEKEIKRLTLENKEKDKKIEKLEADYDKLKGEQEKWERLYLELEKKYQELTGEG